MVASHSSAYQRMQLLLGISIVANVALIGYVMAGGRSGSQVASPIKSRMAPLNRMPQFSTRGPMRTNMLARAGADQGPILSVTNGEFKDYRWVDGTWDTSKFENDGKVNWDKVIDAEIARRKIVIENKLVTPTDGDVKFDAAEIPWWAWVSRFHLPEAEKLNGRAAMLGYMAALGVDQLTKIGIYDQHTSLWGRLTVAATVVGVFYYREFGYDNLTDEQKIAVDEVKAQLMPILNKVDGLLKP